MSTAYAATSQVWAARRPQQADHPNHFSINNATRGSPPPALPNDTQIAQNAKASWRAPVTLFVKLEFGISFGDRDRGGTSRAKTLAINYPSNDTSNRTPRFLLPDAAHGRRAISEEPRGGRQKQTMEIPLSLPQAYPQPPVHTASYPQQHQAQRHGFYQQDAQRAASATVLPTAPTCYQATRQARQNSQPPAFAQAHSYSGIPQANYSAIAPPRRQLTREFLEGKSLPSLPAGHRLGDPGMPWDSENPIGPILDTSRGGIDIGDLTPHSADAAHPSRIGWPSQTPNQMQNQNQTRPSTSTSTPNSPIISPQSSFTTPARVLSWDARNKQWIAASSHIVSPPLPDPTTRARPVLSSTLHSRSLGNTRPQIPTIESVSHPYTYGSPQLPPLNFETEEERREREMREERRLATDPQRAEDLSVLSAAMVAVDVLDDRFAPEGSNKSLNGKGKERESDSGGGGGNGKSNRRSLGWAVRVEPAAAGAQNANGNVERAGYDTSVRRNQNRTDSIVSDISALSFHEPINQRQRDYLNPIPQSQATGPVHAPASGQTDDRDPEYWRAVNRRRSWTTGDPSAGLGRGIVLYK